MGNVFAVRQTRPGRIAIATLLGTTILALTACGSSSKLGTPAASTTQATSAAASSSPAAATSSAAIQSSAAADDCGGAVARVTTAVANFPEVTKVQTIAACHEVDIQTNLPSGVLGSPSATKGADICDAAAKVAYQGDVSSITVTATDGHELATGLKTADCIPG